MFRSIEKLLPELQGDVADQYTYVKDLGEGGFGKVTLVRKVADGREVALKEVMVDSGDPDAKNLMRMLKYEIRAQRILTEASAGCRDYLVCLEDAFYRKNDTGTIIVIYMVLTYMPRPLGYYSTHRPMMKELLTKAVRSLAFIHKNGILHRDIKPSNMYYDQVTSTVRFGDFGLSCAVDKCGKKEAHCRTMAAFLDPHHLMRGGTVTSAASDVYSLGATFYKLYFGESYYTNWLLKERDFANRYAQFSNMISDRKLNDDVVVNCIYKMMNPTPDFRARLADVDAALTSHKGGGSRSNGSRSNRSRSNRSRLRAANKSRQHA